jgi:hypothetical protein
MHTAELLVETLHLTSSLTPEALAAAWGGVNEDGLTALVANEGAVLWLLRRLEALGATDAAPSAFIRWLREQARGLTARNMLVDTETEGVLRLLADRGTPYVLIKGTARRAASALYPYADARATNDVDLLLPEPEVQPAWEYLLSLGWSRATARATRIGHYHPPPLLGPHGVGVELHSSTRRTLPAAECWRRMAGGAIIVEWHGLSVRVPEATELLWHGLTHAVGDGVRGFRLRYFLDGSALLAGHTVLDWPRIAARLAAGEPPDSRAANWWLSAAAQLAGAELPAGFGHRGDTRDLIRLLRWRLAVLARCEDAGLGARLLEEGTRTELGMPPAEVVPGTGVFKQTRRWLGGRAARVIYRLWRATR